MSSVRTLTASTRRSARLVTWARAWRAGTVSYDDVADETERGEEHLVADAPDTWSDVPLREAIRTLSRLHPDEIRLVLPVPGDPRGLPGPGPFSRAAMAAGEGVLFADAGLGVVPSVIADGVLRWTVHPVPDPGPAPEHVALPQAERDLRDQVRRSASVLTSLGVARHRPGVREEIAAKLRARPETLWPAGMPAPALRVLQHADEVEAILAAASVDEPGGALSASAATARREALRPLETAVRVARRAAVTEAVRVLAASPLV